MFRPWEDDVGDKGEGVGNEGDIADEEEDEDDVDGEMSKKSNIEDKTDNRKRLNFKEVKIFLRTRQYPHHARTHNQKANFRRQCKPFKLEGNTLYYIGGKKNQNLEQEKNLSGRRKVITNKNKRRQLIKSAHEGHSDQNEAVAMAAHQGRDRVYEILRQRYYWPGMVGEVSQYCLLCVTCQKVNPAVLKVRDYLHPVGVPKRVMAQIGIDLCTLPESSAGLKYLVVAIDYFSKWVEARGIPDKTAVSVARFLYEDIVCRHSCPETIISDQGKEFNNELVDELNRLTGVKHRVTRPYHPQANGLVERLNQTIKNGLLKVIREDTKVWPEVLPGVLFAYRAAVQRSTRYSPFFLMYQRSPLLPMDVSGMEINTEDEEDEYRIFQGSDEAEEGEEIDMVKFHEILNFSETLRSKIHDAALENIKKAQEDQAVQYNRKHLTGSDFCVGQRVLLVNSRRQERKGGWEEFPRTGPYVIVELDARKGAKLQNEKGRVLKTVFPIKRLYPFRHKDDMVPKNDDQTNNKAKNETNEDEVKNKDGKEEKDKDEDEVKDKGEDGGKDEEKGEDGKDKGEDEEKDEEGGKNKDDGEVKDKDKDEGKDNGENEDKDKDKDGKGKDRDEGKDNDEDEDKDKDKDGKGKDRDEGKDNDEDEDKDKDKDGKGKDRDEEKKTQTPFPDLKLLPRVAQVQKQPSILFHRVGPEWQHSTILSRDSLKNLPIEMIKLPEPEKKALPIGPVKATVRVDGDGNCWFRSISVYLFGNAQHHAVLRKLITDYMSSDIRENVKKFAGEDIFLNWNMPENGVWATEVEILATASFLNTTIYLFSKPIGRLRLRNEPLWRWNIFSPKVLTGLKRKRGQIEEAAGRSIYIYHQNGNHFEPVIDIYN